MSEYKLRKGKESHCSQASHLCIGMLEDYLSYEGKLIHLESNVILRVRAQ